MAQQSGPTTQPDPTRARRRKSWLLLAAAALVFLGAVIFAQASMNAGEGAFGKSAAKQPNAEASAGNAQAESGAEAPTAPGFETRDPDDPMAIGDVDAPVVLVEWTDMRCPYCAVFNQETLPKLVSEYVESGKVRIEVRDVAFFGDASETASVAARAAGNQGKFVEYLDAVYAAAPAEGHPDLPRKQLIGFAEQIGVADMAQFTADLDDPKLRAAVQASTASAQQIGVTGVPFFAVGTSAMSGAQPVETFRTFLDDAVAAADGAA